MSLIKRKSIQRTNTQESINRDEKVTWFQDYYFLLFGLERPNIFLILGVFITFMIPQKIFQYIGYRSRFRIQLMREKVGLLLFTIIFVSTIGMATTLLFKCSRNGPQISWSILSSKSAPKKMTKLILIEGDLYEQIRPFKDKLRIVRNKGLRLVDKISDKINQFSSEDKENVLMDWSFIFSIHGKCPYYDYGYNTIFPCSIIGLTTFNIFPKSTVLNNSEPIVCTNIKNKRIEKKYTIEYEYNDLTKNVNIGCTVLDFSRLNYFNPKMEQYIPPKIRMLFTEIFKQRDKNRDITYLIRNHGLTDIEMKNLEDCILKRLKIGNIDGSKPICLFLNTFIIGSVLLITFLTLGTIFYELIWVPYFCNDIIRKDKKISGTYLITKYKKHIKKRKSLIKELFLTQNWLEINEFFIINLNINKNKVVNRNLLDKKSIEKIITKEGSYPFTLQYEKPELKKGTIHLSQSDHFNSNLINYDPLKVLLLMNVSFFHSHDIVIETLKGLCSCYYPSSHKAIITIYDGIEMSNEDGNWIKMIKMLQNLVIPINETRCSSYTALGSGILKHNTVKIFSGYLAYNFTTDKILYNTESDDIVMVPIVVIVKMGHQNEIPINYKINQNNTRIVGTRGIRDSMSMIFSTIHNLNYNMKLSPFNFDLNVLFLSISGSDLFSFDIVSVLSPGLCIHKNMIKDIVSDFVYDPQLIINKVVVDIVSFNWISEGIAYLADQNSDINFYRMSIQSLGYKEILELPLKSTYIKDKNVLIFNTLFMNYFDLHPFRNSGLPWLVFVDWAPLVYIEYLISRIFKKFKFKISKGYISKRLSNVPTKLTVLKLSLSIGIKFWLAFINLFDLYPDSKYELKMTYGNIDDKKRTMFFFIGFYRILTIFAPIFGVMSFFFVALFFLDRIYLDIFNPSLNPIWSLFIIIASTNCIESIIMVYRHPNKTKNLIFIIITMVMWPFIYLPLFLYCIWFLDSMAISPYYSNILEFTCQSNINTSNNDEPNNHEIKGGIPIQTGPTLEPNNVDLLYVKDIQTVPNNISNQKDQIKENFVSLTPSKDNRISMFNNSDIYSFENLSIDRITPPKIKSIYPNNNGHNTESLDFYEFNCLSELQLREYERVTPLIIPTDLIKNKKTKSRSLDIKKSPLLDEGIHLKSSSKIHKNHLCHLIKNNETDNQSNHVSLSSLPIYLALSEDEDCELDTRLVKSPESSIFFNKEFNSHIQPLNITNKSGDENIRNRLRIEVNHFNDESQIPIDINILMSPMMRREYKDEDYDTKLNKSDYKKNEIERTRKIKLELEYRVPYRYYHEWTKIKSHLLPSSSTTVVHNNRAVGSNGKRLIGSLLPSHLSCLILDPHPLNSDDLQVTFHKIRLSTKQSPNFPIFSENENFKMITEAVIYLISLSAGIITSVSIIIILYLYIWWCSLEIKNIDSFYLGTGISDYNENYKQEKKEDTEINKEGWIRLSTESKPFIGPTIYEKMEHLVLRNWRNSWTTQSDEVNESPSSLKSWMNILSKKKQDDALSISCSPSDIPNDISENLGNNIQSNKSPSISFPYDKISKVDILKSNDHRKCKSENIFTYGWHFAVLKKDTLFFYKDEKKEECILVVVLSFYSISLFNEGPDLKDIFMPAFPLLLSQLSSKQVVASDGSYNITITDLEDENYPRYYIFAENLYEKDDWYLSLAKVCHKTFKVTNKLVDDLDIPLHILLDESPHFYKVDPNTNTPIHLYPSVYNKEYQNHIIDDTEKELHIEVHDFDKNFRCYNAIIGRIYNGIRDAFILKKFIITRFNSIVKSKLPYFISIKLIELILPTNIPLINYLPKNIYNSKDGVYQIQTKIKADLSMSGKILVTTKRLLPAILSSRLKYLGDKIFFIMTIFCLNIYWLVIVKGDSLLNIKIHSTPTRRIWVGLSSLNESDDTENNVGKLSKTVNIKLLINNKEFILPDFCVNFVGYILSGYIHNSNMIDIPFLPINKSAPLVKVEPVEEVHAKTPELIQSLSNIVQTPETSTLKPKSSFSTLKSKLKRKTTSLFYKSDIKLGTTQLMTQVDTPNTRREPNISINLTPSSSISNSVDFSPIHTMGEFSMDRNTLDSSEDTLSRLSITTQSDRDSTKDSNSILSPKSNQRPSLRNIGWLPNSRTNSSDRDLSVDDIDINAPSPLNEINRYSVCFSDFNK